VGGGGRNISADDLVSLFFMIQKMIIIEDVVDVVESGAARGCR